MNQLQWNWNKFNPLKNGGKGNVIEENIIVPKNCLGYFLEKSRVFKFLFSKFAFLTDAKISNMKNLMFSFSYCVNFTLYSFYTDIHVYQW